MTEARARVTFREVFGVAEFRALWLAELFSIMGDQLARVALSVMVFRDTGSAALTGLTFALTFLPSLLGGIFLSGIADRYPRREVMVVVDIVRAGLIALVAIPGLPFWTMATLVGSVSMLNPVFKSAQLALLPDVLEGDRFLVGMGIRSITIQSAQLIGFGGGGLLMIAVDPRLALVLDAATFAVSALLVRSGLSPRPAARKQTEEKQGWLRSIGNGGRQTLAVPGVAALMVLIWMMALITAYEGMAAPYSQVVGAGTVGVGLLLICDPIGGVIGAFAFSRWVPAEMRPRLIGPCAIAAGALLLICLLKPGLPVSMALFIVSGGLGTIVVMQATASFTRTIPDESRAQVIGLSNTGLTTASGLAPLAAGVVADWLGPQPAVGWMGVVGLVLTVPAVIAWQRAYQANPRRWAAAE
jgi:predicted MFS family arabinose efflux permease